MSSPKLCKEQERDMVRAWYKENIADVVADVRKLFPHIKMNDEVLEKDCLFHIFHAVEMDLSSGVDILGFLVLRHQIGLNFYKLPAVKRVLVRTDLLPGDKIASMLMILPPSYWASAPDKLWGLK